MSKVYIVRGYTGIYREDTYTWQVAAFSERIAADRFCKLAQARADEVERIIRDSDDLTFYDARHKEFPNKYDPNYTMNDGGISYSVVPAPFNPQIED